MKFDNAFEVDAPPASVWDALMDFERVVPCMPGAELLERQSDDAYQVQVRVKVGPMSMTYRGTVEISDRDEQTRTAAMRAQARETRGQGTANATVQIKLSENGRGTEAEMVTDLRLSGRAATMGRGVISDVSQALISRFADNLQQLLSGPASAPAGQAPTRVSSPPPPSSPPSEPAALDAGQLARRVVTNRLRDSRTSAWALAVAAVFGFLLGRSRRS